jgi:hypothetical protein
VIALCLKVRLNLKKLFQTIAGFFQGDLTGVKVPGWEIGKPVRSPVGILMEWEMFFERNPGVIVVIEERELP